METLRRGSRGAGVRQLQRLLMVTADGVFGKDTEEAVKDFQRSKGLVADGIVGSRTWEALGVKVSYYPPNEGEGLDIVDGHINTHVTPLLNRQLKYIAIHYTAGSTSKGGTALATRNVFLTRSASADFVVDNKQIVQINPDLKNYYCWAVGDKRSTAGGGGRLGGVATNRNTISIEICSNLMAGTTAAVPNHEGWYFTDDALNNAMRLVRYLMKKYGIPKQNVVRHYDITGKLCPGLIGWNDGRVYDTAGKVTKEKNNSDEWLAWWEKI